MNVPGSSGHSGRRLLMMVQWPRYPCPASA